MVDYATGDWLLPLQAPVCPATPAGLAAGHVAWRVGHTLGAAEGIATATPQQHPTSLLTPAPHALLEASAPD